MKKCFIAFAAALLSAAAAPAADIYMAGDSTCANYPQRQAPMTGWGQVLQNCCKPGVKVDNRAIPGSDTGSFIRRKAWDKLLTSVKPGDFVIIQFGHNDQKNGKNDVTTTYPKNLKRMISDVRKKGATPVLVTSVPRARFNRDGSKTVNCGLQAYHDAMVKVGEETNTEVVDLYARTRDYFDSVGEDGVLELFMYSSETPGAAKTDRTHLRKNGAEKIAELFAETAKKTNAKIASLLK